MATKQQLSRQYVYAPLSDTSFDLADADVAQVAFMTDATTEPTDTDWVSAIVVDDTHELYDADIGEALAVLVGPARGDTVTTEDLATGDYTVWSDVSTPGSDERLVSIHGTLSITAGS